MLAQSYGNEDGYTVKDYYNQLYSLVFHSGRLTTQDKTLQRAIVNAIAPVVAKANGRKLVEEEQILPDIFSEDRFRCYDIEKENEFREDRTPFQNEINIATIDETMGYDIIFLKKIMKKANKGRKFGASNDRAHYEYIYGKVASALGAR